MRSPDSFPLAVVLALIAATGCQEPPAPHSGLLTRELVTLQDGSQRVSIIGEEVLGDWESEPVELQEGTSLEFLPLVPRNHPPVTFRVLVRAGEIFQDVAAVAAGSKTDDGRRTLSWPRPVRVDLTPFAGSTVQLVFRLEGSEAGRRGIVGVPRLRRRVIDSPRPPDVLMVCSDTLRWDTSLGDRGIRLMPELRSLRGEGVAYRRAFSASSWTLPSIATSLTGLFPRFHGAGERALSASIDPPPGHFRFKIGAESASLRGYSSDLISLPERLLEAGFSTRAVVTNPLYFLSGLARDGLEIAVDASIADGAFTNRVARRMIETSDPDLPLFLLVHYMEAHEWRKQYFRFFGPDSEPERHPDDTIRAYEAAVMSGDRALGDLLDTWRLHRNNESLIVFWSDHGEHLLEDGLLGHGNSMREVLLNVPLFVGYPASLAIEAGGDDSFVSLADLVPTVLDVVGLDYDPFTLSGRSLLDNEEPRSRRFFADYQLYGAELASIRQAEFKLVMNLETGESELWQVLGNGTESRADDPGLEEELSASFEAYLADALEARKGMKLPHAVDEAEALEALRALGYIE